MHYVTCMTKFLSTKLRYEETDSNIKRIVQNDIQPLQYIHFGYE